MVLIKGEVGRMDEDEVVIEQGLLVRAVPPIEEGVASPSFHLSERE